MWRGGATAAFAARTLRSRLVPEPIHNPATSLAPVASARASSSAAASNTVAHAAAAAAAVSQQAGSFCGALRHYGSCYWELSKARLSALVVATSGAGYVLGSGNIVDIAGLCFTCTGTMMVAASANTLNQVFEIKNDAKMKRTMWRPLPSGRISPAHAAMWATSVGAAGTALLAWKANGLAAGLAASNLVLYAFVYTPLKQIHPVNTWVGAVVGAIPPLLGRHRPDAEPRRCITRPPSSVLSPVVPSPGFDAEIGIRTSDRIEERIQRLALRTEEIDVFFLLDYLTDPHPRQPAASKGERGQDAREESSSISLQ